MEPERGLAQMYIERVRALATHALQGQEVDTRVSQLVREAMEHFRAAGINHDPAGTLEYFVGQLRFQADHVDASQHVYAETLRKAAHWASQAIQEN